MYSLVRTAAVRPFFCKLPDFHIRSISHPIACCETAYFSLDVGGRSKKFGWATIYIIRGASSWLSCPLKDGGVHTFTGPIVPVLSRAVEKSNAALLSSLLSMNSLSPAIHTTHETEMVILFAPIIIAGKHHISGFPYLPVVPHPRISPYRYLVMQSAT